MLLKYLKFPIQNHHHKVWFSICNIVLSDCDEVESEDSYDHDELTHEDKQQKSQTSRQGEEMTTHDAACVQCDRKMDYGDRSIACVYLYWQSVETIEYTLTYEHLQIHQKGRTSAISRILRVWRRSERHRDRDVHVNQDQNIVRRSGQIKDITQCRHGLVNSHHLRLWSQGISLNVEASLLKLKGAPGHVWCRVSSQERKVWRNKQWRTLNMELWEWFRKNQDG